MHLSVDLESIATSLGYTHPSIGNRPYPFHAITKFEVGLFANAMCTNPAPMGGFFCKRIHLGEAENRVYIKEQDCS